MMRDGLGADVSTTVDVGGGVQVPGSAIASAAYEFYKKPSAEGAANAAMRTMCGIATAGSPASNICSYFTVAGLLAAGDWFANNVLGPAGAMATGVYQCTFSFPEIALGAETSVLAMQSVLNTTWYATRAGIKLPFKHNADAAPVYSAPTTSYVDSAGHTQGINSQAKLIGYSSKRVAALLAKDKDWNSYPSVVWPDALGEPAATALRMLGKRTIFLQSAGGPFDYGMSPSSSPFIDCQGYAPQFNSLLGGLYTQYRLEPARRAVAQVLTEWGVQFDVEHAQQLVSSAKAKNSSAAIKRYIDSKQSAKDANMLVLVLALAGLVVGGGVAIMRKKKR